MLLIVQTTELTHCLALFWTLLASTLSGRAHAHAQQTAPSRSCGQDWYGSFCPPSLSYCRQCQDLKNALSAPSQGVQHTPMGSCYENPSLLDSNTPPRWLQSLWRYAWGIKGHHTRCRGHQRLNTTKFVGELLPVHLIWPQGQREEHTAQFYWAIASVSVSFLGEGDSSSIYKG